MLRLSPRTKASGDGVLFSVRNTEASCTCTHARLSEHAGFSHEARLYMYIYICFNSGAARGLCRPLLPYRGFGLLSRISHVALRAFWVDGCNWESEPWTRKVCRIMAFVAVILSLGLLFYILLGFR